MAVHPPELDGRAVEEHHAVLHLNLPQAHLLLDYLVAGGEDQGVLAGVLGVPERGVLQLKAEGAPAPLEGGAARQGVVWIQQGGGEGDLPLGLQLHGHLGLGEVLGKALLHEEIPEESGGALQQVHVPEDAAHAQLVLVLQIAAVAPLEHQRGESVGPVAVEESGDLELGGAVRDLAIAHESAVHPQVEAGVHALEVQEIPGVLPLVQAQGELVDAAGVLLWHIGGGHGDGVADVCVHMTAPAHALPAAGHRDGGHGAGVQAQKAGLVYRVQEGVEIPEGPFAAEAMDPGLALWAVGEVVAAVGGCTHVEGGGVLVIEGGEAVRVAHKQDPFFTILRIGDTLRVHKNRGAVNCYFGKRRGDLTFPVEWSIV